jgi:uncharacterized damage-inducible protein DinB
MDILDRYLGYEGWTQRHMIRRCQELSTAQLHQHFDIGHNTLHETLSHVIRNLETWTDLMAERPVRTMPPIPADAQSYLQRFDAAMADFNELARTLAAQNRLDDSNMYVLDNPPASKTFGGTLLHLLTHTTVHRWEVQHMLQRLGLEVIEGDALSWEWRLHNNAL